MYLGSVRFFKHLIVTVVVLMIAGLSTAVIFLAMENNKKAGEIEALNFELSQLSSFAYNGSPEGVPGDDLEEPGNNNDDNDPLLPPVPPVTTPPEEIKKEPESPYMSLLPHMYSDYTPPADYINDTGYIYLTFDDGPSQYTTDILRYLLKHDIQATFFVMPDDTENGRSFLNTMLERGHEIGIHCMSHFYSDIYASVEAYLEDFNEAWNLVYEQTGYKPYLFRFPGGSKNDYNGAVRDDIIAEMTRRGFIYYDWNVDSRDAMDADWTSMYNTVLNEVAAVPRAVVLFHDRPGGYNTVLVIEDIIRALLADPQNYVFSAITRETAPMQF